MTTRGMREPEMQAIGRLIAQVLRAGGDVEVQRKVRQAVLELTRSFPLYRERLLATAQQ